MQELSDKEIINLFRDEKTRERSFSIIVNKYKEKLYWHIRKIVIDHSDADDVLQNTFIKAWKNLSGFREDAGLFTWLFRIATNESLSFIKKQKTASLFSLDSNEYHLSQKLENDIYFDGDDLQKKLQKAILKLPDKQRIVFNMKYYDEMKYEEIAKILETSVGALKASYHHAVKKIEKYIAEF